MQAPLVAGAIALALALPLTAAAQSAPNAGTPAPAAKPAPKAAGTNPKLARSAQKAVEERTPIDDDPSIQIGDLELEIAKQVHVGDMPCELGASVRVTPARRVGLFVVTTRGHRFLMHPVESRTGAIRLEDARRGAMWLQLGNKSMLMSQKLGRRLADECQSPQQVTFAEELKRNPRPSILDAPTPAAPAPASPAAPAAAAPAPASAAPSAPASAPADAAPAATPAASAPAATSTAPAASAPQNNN